MAATLGSASSAQARDDAITICAISLVAAMISDTLHEALGHAAVALLTVADSGVVSTVAWSSAVDSRLVAAGGTLVNLAAALVFWIVLRAAKSAPAGWRYFFLVSAAFNLFGGTGYFFFSGVTNFGDWAVVIAGLPSHAVWRTLLVVFGFAAYFGAAVIVGIGVVRYAGVPRSDVPRLRKLLFIPYFSSIFILSVSGLLNPVGPQLVWQSALPASAGAGSGLLWLRFYIPKSTVPERGPDAIGKSWAWILVAIALSLVFIFVLGRGIRLHR
jgi:hypothetical protein